MIVAGLQPDGQHFIGMVSMIGVHYTDSCICTGFASHLALPLLRQYQQDSMSEQEAKGLMQDALRVRHLQPHALAPAATCRRAAARSGLCFGLARFVCK